MMQFNVLFGLPVKRNSLDGIFRASVTLDDNAEAYIESAIAQHDDIDHIVLSASNNEVILNLYAS